MAHVDGSLARQLDFGEAVAPRQARPAGLRLAPVPARLSGPDKYKVLDHRRHQAQIKARRLLGEGQISMFDFLPMPDGMPQGEAQVREQ